MSQFQYQTQAPKCINLPLPEYMQACQRIGSMHEGLPLACQHAQKWLFGHPNMPKYGSLACMLPRQACYPPCSQQRHLCMHDYSPDLGCHRNLHQSTPRVDQRTGRHRSTFDWSCVRKFLLKYMTFLLSNILLLTCHWFI